MLGGNNWLVVAALSVVFGAACGDDTTADDGQGASGGVGAGGACPDGLTPSEANDELVCAPTLPDNCGPGTMPSLFESTCRPVGWVDCPEGFALDPTGWACVGILPPTCGGATRDALGATTCTPIGDCDTTFPPTGATVFVDQSFTAGDLNATHFAQLDDATNAAPAGAVIAVAPGTYGGTLTLSKPLTIYGKCAAEVHLVGPVLGTPGIRINSGGDLTLSGVTISKHDTGIWVSPGGRIKVTDALLDQNLDEGMRITGGEVHVERSVIRGTLPSSPNAQTLGVFAYGGAQVTLDDTAVTNNVEAGIGLIDAGTVVTANRVVVRDTQWQGTASGGMGIKAFDGSRLVISDCVVDNSHTTGILIGGPGVTAEAKHLVVSGTQLNPTTGDIGWAVITRLGADLQIADSTIIDNDVIGVSADKSGTIDAERVTIAGTRPVGWLGVGVGAITASDSQVTFADSAFIRNAGIALTADRPGASLTLNGSIVHGTLPSQSSERSSAGRGGTAVGVTNGAHAILNGTTIDGGAEVAAAAYSEGSTLSLNGVLIDGTAQNGGGLFGYGVMAKDGGVATVKSSYLRGQTSVALVFAAGSGWVDQTYIEGNGIGIHVQGGTALIEQAGVGEVTLGQAIVSETTFWNNGARVGTGEVSVPDALATSP